MSLDDRIRIIRMSPRPADKIRALQEIDKLYREDPNGEDYGFSLLPQDIVDLLEKKWAWEASQKKPKSNCHWVPSDHRNGTGLCIGDQNYIIPRNKYDNVRQLPLRLLHIESGIQGIYYFNGQPDFSPCAYDSVKVEGYSFIRYQADMTQEEKLLEECIQERAIKQFALKWGWGQGQDAIERVRNFLSNLDEPDFTKRRLYVLHECIDLETVMIVPREIHAFYKHSGGISLYEAVFK